MPFRVMSNWSRFAEGDIITGGDIAELGGCVGILPGWTPPTEIEREKLGLSKGGQVTDERIRELIDRGIIQGFGEDAVIQPLKPVKLGPTFEDRVQAAKNMDLTLLSTDEAARARNRQLQQFKREMRVL